MCGGRGGGKGAGRGKGGNEGEGGTEEGGAADLAERVTTYLASRCVQPAGVEEGKGRGDGPRKGRERVASGTTLLASRLGEKAWEGATAQHLRINSTCAAHEQDSDCQWVRAGHKRPCQSPDLHTRCHFFGNCNLYPYSPFAML